MSESFYMLTPEAVLESVETAGFIPSGHCQALNSLENRVYDVRLESGDHLVAKFYRPGRWSREQILEEHAFLAELRASDVPVCAPNAFPDGGTLKETNEIYFAIWPRTGGRMMDELTEEDLQILGRLTARLHTVGAGKQATSRLTLDTNKYARRPLQAMLERSVIPPHLEARYTDAVFAVADMYDDLSSDVPLQRIHGDLHNGNLLHGEDGWFLLDFDDFLTGPAMQDIWMLVPAQDDYGRHQRDIFLAAYRQFREFPEHWLRLAEALRALRFIHYSGWIAKRYDDPAFTEAFPQYTSDDYWEQQTNDLETQIAILRGEAVAQGEVRDLPGDTAPELTNKDFFWDWEETEG